MPIKILCQRGSSSDFWGKFWKERLEGESLEEYYQEFKKSPILVRIFEEYLPSQGKILDAGCGSGIWTVWLRRRGYSVEGIDISGQIIGSVKRVFPDLPIQVGDVFDLQYADRSLQGYLSLGVIGYFLPDKIVKEAARVLDAGGVAILRVPYNNPLRRIKHLFGCYKKQSTEYSQYAFTVKELTEEMNKIGLKVVHSDFYESLQGFKDEIFGVRSFQSDVKRTKYSKKRNGKAKYSFLKIVKYFFDTLPMRFLFSHTLIVVAKKYA